jgi:hypothetical protein
MAIDDSKGKTRVNKPVSIIGRSEDRLTNQAFIQRNIIMARVTATH